jgi:hypothetical protein
MKDFRQLDVNEMARVAGGFAFGGDGYCGTIVPGQFIPRPHGGGDPWVINSAALGQYQANPVTAGAMVMGKIAAF